jgi:hypothetical protein
VKTVFQGRLRKINYKFLLAFCMAFLAGTARSQLFVANEGGDNVNPGYIGEYTTSGATVNASLVSGLDNTGGHVINSGYLTIAGNDIFVANRFSGTIGEYTTSGTTVNASLVSGLDGPDGLAVVGNDIFIVNDGSYQFNSPIAFTIGEYTTSGATVNAPLISGLDAPWGLATIVPPQPVFQSVVQTNDTLTLVWSSVTTQSYQLQYTTDLTSTNWTDLGGINTATNSTMSATDVIGSDTQRFYRVVRSCVISLVLIQISTICHALFEAQKSSPLYQQRIYLEKRETFSSMSQQLWADSNVRHAR